MESKNLVLAKLKLVILGSQKSVDAVNADDHESNKGKIISPSLERCKPTSEKGLRKLSLKEQSCVVSSEPEDA